MAFPDRWRSRLRTAMAMAALCWARLVVTVFPFNRWRNTLGGMNGNNRGEPARSEARRLAAHVEWAARLLPLSTKCLPRAMALSWLLRRRRVDHCVVFAARPAGQRETDHPLHAWVEIDGERVIGDLPGPWVETLRQGPGGR